MDDGPTVGTLGEALRAVVGFVFDQYVDIEQRGPTFTTTSESVETLLHLDHPKGNERV
ncbi:hypothetical protein ACFQMA_01635 [Halosimplex aquaticum]|uniref:Uncharacterized protein n=1 Tax=Halosimplex aquaticum TaxID=3026162 RepID=A0ABD5Y2A6_9EURY|nr:hypothetical protein [Halosimplex aquaticum]